MIRTVIISLSLLAFVPAAMAAKTPSDRKLSKDVSKRWKKQWPEQEVAHVAKKSECVDALIEVPSKVLGKTRKLKTCRVDVDVYISVGFRYHIYRGTQAHYQGSRLVRLFQGELQKVWKAGGVPAPSPEQAMQWLQAQAQAKFGPEAQVTIVETGQPRIFGETFRLTYVVDVKLPTKDGKEQSRKGLMATFESEGGDWKAVEKLSL